MQNKQPVSLDALALPAPIAGWIGDAQAYESSGGSGAKTYYIDQGEGAYLKIGPAGTLAHAAVMQGFFSARRLSPPVVQYIPGGPSSGLQQDYMLTAALHGEDGTAPALLAQPARLAALFGRSLRRLHSADPFGCPVQNRMAPLLHEAPAARYDPHHLSRLAPYIGPADETLAAEEIRTNAHILRNDVLLHGDYCLPNIIIRNWHLAGFIDVADGGYGDRHYDLAWGLWTLHYNLKTADYGKDFLAAYGHDAIDMGRLRICGLLAAME